MKVEPEIESDGRYGPLGGVYFIRCQGFIKIGRANQVKQRFWSMQPGSPFLLQPLGYIPCRDEAGARQCERELHQRFTNEKVRGEWFHDCPAVREAIQAMAIPWPPKIGRHPK